MRTVLRRRDGPKEGFGDRAQKVGALLAGFAAVLMVLGAAVHLGLEPLLTAHRDRTILRQIEAQRPGAPLVAGGPVVLSGRIDPETVVPVGGGGLALLQAESWRINWTWGWELTHHPDFRLLLTDGSVTVVNGCRREETGFIGRLINPSRKPGTGLDNCYRIGGKWDVAQEESGRRRFFGFRPGDEVHVVGNLHGDRLHAISVFGGSPEDYAATLRGSVWPLVVGVVIGLALVAGASLMAYMMVCCARPLGRRAPASDPETQVR
jgi:hypothetical protein